MPSSLGSLRILSVYVYVQLLGSKLKNELRILYRANSWSRIKITLEMFKAISTFNLITPRFLNIIFGMGRKRASLDEHYMTCYCHWTVCQAMESNETRCTDGNESQNGEIETSYESYGLCALTINGFATLLWLLQGDL